METDALFQKLKALNEYEELGKQFYEICHCQMDYIQLLYYLEQKEQKPDITLLSSYITSQLRSISSKNSQDSLNEATAERYISKPSTIEMQQLLRYVQVPKHRHDFFELVFVLSGECTHVIGDQSFLHTTGDFTIIPPGIPHYLEAAADCVCLTAKTTEDTFRTLFFKILHQNSTLSSYLSQSMSHPWFRCAMTLHAGSDYRVRDMLLQLYDQQEQARAYGTVIIESLFQVLLAYLLQNYEDNAEFLVSDSVRQKQIVEILAYVFANYQTVTLRQTAEHFHYHLSYLSTRIRELTGQTFSALLKDYKMQQAKELLTSTKLPLNEICIQAGYSNCAQFIRSFKELTGLTPMQYRKEHS